MTSAPILRSSALQKALALTPIKAALPAGGFASTFTQAQTKSTVTRYSVAAAWSAASARPATGGIQTVSFSAAPGADGVPYKDLITAAANKYGFDPALLAAVVKQESNFNPRAQSGAGAKGLTQLMDATARGLGVTDSFDPAQSLDGGAKFLGGLLKQFHGDPSLALAAYNAGPGAVQKYGGVPPYEETRRYIPKVLGYVTEFRRLWANSTGSPINPTH